jgi:holo-[acyl-carrier protein] synthase
MLPQGLPGEYDAAAASPPSGGVVAVGVDVVSVARFGAALTRTPALAARLFTTGEQTTVSGHRRSAASLAARFAAKEAVAKALGAPRGLDWHHCVVEAGSDGRPRLVMSGTVAAAAAARGVVRFEVSLTHDAGIAAAVVVAVR